MKASIQLDKGNAVPTLRGTLGITNAPYTAMIELKRPDGTTENLVVPHSGSETWEISLGNCAPGSYEALIKPREGNAFEATRLAFSL
ncbi:hypothetical protein ACIPZ8_05280 [Pseudomonas sp. NPDC089422]|uniref:hypothetical protein n=1 Tax=Pseudomonas sp. NPDC089422 TaxID=3364466 RepID=UPI003822E926